MRRFSLSENGEKMLFESDHKFFIVAADKAPKPATARSSRTGWRSASSPQADWKQIYHEVWRIERDFFYDPHYHGLDLAAAEKAYAPYLEGRGSRADLNDLLDDMLGNFMLLHMFVRGRLIPIRTRSRGPPRRGLHGRPRPLPVRARLRRGELEPGSARAADPAGVNVKAGEYLLAVNGAASAPPTTSIAFSSASGQSQTSLNVGPKPT